MYDGVRVRVDDKAARDFAKRAPGHIDLRLSEWLAEFGARLKRLVQDNIRTEGGVFGRPWTAPSKWTVAKHGHSRLLEGMEKYVTMRATKTTVQVGFRSPGDWTLTQHHEGFVTPASGEREWIELRSPGVLGKKTNRFSFVSRRESVTPARRMWPTKTYLRQITEPGLKAWLLRTMASAPGVR